MKDYNMPFKNAAIDRFGGKFGKDKPTHQNVDFKANAEKRVAENVKKPGSINYTNTNWDDQRTQISSLKDPQPKTYIEAKHDVNRPYQDKGTKWHKGNKNYNKFLDDAETNMSSSFISNKGMISNAHQKMKTIAPSYVDPKGPNTLQGTNKRGTKIAKNK
jgi:hypothetical protein